MNNLKEPTNDELARVVARHFLDEQVVTGALNQKFLLFNRVPVYQDFTYRKEDGSDQVYSFFKSEVQSLPFRSNPSSWLRYELDTKIANMRIQLWIKNADQGNPENNRVGLKKVLNKFIISPSGFTFEVDLATLMH